MKFKELSANDYFRFKDGKNSIIYRKLSAGRIRKLGESEIIRYFKNEEVEYLGNDMAQFVYGSKSKRFPLSK